ncbi:phosphonate C-P lyase system protein PhnH [Pinisolibacter sp.]|uniref:phosphonate C-P lyase system protein PhnH n=1 Tax=Pinisolibacter sp. TaxID=2172024 RepID=UPI002FDE470C
MAPTATTIAPGFRDPVFQSQATFRAVLDALAEPGTERPVEGIATAPAPLAPVAAAVIATLADFETAVWRDETLRLPEIEAWLAFHTGAPVALDPARAAFALIGADDAPDFTDFALGSDVDPSTSATLVLRVAGFDNGRRYRLSGPGIDGACEVTIAGAPTDLADRLAANRALFPRGVDLILSGSTSVMGLPRTTRIEEIR